MKNINRLSLLLVLALLVAIPMFAAPKASSVATPVLSEDWSSTTQASIALVVAAPPSTVNQYGLPAGFSVQWMTETDYIANGGWVSSDDSRLCKASFSGNASGYNWALSPGESVVVMIGEPLPDIPDASVGSESCTQALHCDLRVVFRAFGHATNLLAKSPFSTDFTGATLPCITNGTCTLTQGYWKTHGPIPTGSNINEWPVTSLNLGTVTYTDLELLSILNTPAGGNGLISLAHQLIAAKLNGANGADTGAISAAITAADALIGGLVVPPVGSGSLAPSSTSSLTNTLTAYNEGAIGPGHCN